MIDRGILRIVFRRLMIVGVISLAFVFAMSEIAHLLLKEDTDRPSEQVELVIPKGTAAKVAAGDASPSIPDEMTFVVGDILLVQNEDVVDHQLGPLWIPAGTHASLLLEDANRYDYTCSFHPSQYLGLDVRQKTTMNIRLIALSYVTPATAVVLFVYSLVVFPLNSDREKIKPRASGL